MYDPMNNPWIVYAMAESLRRMTTEDYLAFVRQNYPQVVESLGVSLFQKNRLAGIIKVLEKADKSILYHQLQAHWSFPEVDDVSSPIDWGNAEIRNQFLRSFSDDEIKFMTLAFPALHGVYGKFSSGMSKDVKVHKIIDYCNRSSDAQFYLEMVTALERPYWHPSIDQIDVDHIRQTLKAIAADKDVPTRISVLTQIYQRLGESIPKAKPSGFNFEYLSVMEIAQELIDYVGRHGGAKTLLQLAAEA